MHIAKPLAIVIGAITMWPLIYFAAFMAFIAVTAFSLISAAHQQHEPQGAGRMMYIFIPHILTMLLMFALMAFYIVHVFKNEALKDDRRALWGSLQMKSVVL